MVTRIILKCKNRVSQTGRKGGAEMGTAMADFISKGITYLKAPKRMIKIFWRNRIHRHTRAFTLIELLVVIAIISILASMLMPALKGARDTAKGVFCLNNTRQIAYILIMYTDDFDSYLPSSYSASYSWPFTPNILAAHAGLKDSNNPAYYTGTILLETIFSKCPSVPGPYSTAGRRAPGGALASDYGINNVHVFKMLPDTIKLSSIASPSSTLSFVDAVTLSVRTSDWIAAAPCIAGNAVYEARHTGGANGVFLDGHATRVSENELEIGRAHV